MTRARILADYVSSGDELAAVATTANGALQRSGGVMTGAITTNSTFDGVDIATAVAANTAKVTNYNQTLADINALDVTELGTVTSANLSNTAIVYPAGHILQTVQSTKQDATDMGYSATFGTITGTDQASSGSVFCCKITPTSTSSKILIVATICGQISEQIDEVSQVSFFNGSTNLVNATSPGSRNASFWSGLQEDGVYVNHNLQSYPFTYLDSPSSTSEQTYQFKFRNGGVNEHFYVNRAESDNDNASRGRGQSSIVLMEVAG